MRHINVDSGTDEHALALGSAVDGCGLLETVLALSLICEEKAIHLELNWQDARAAALWRRAAKVLDRAAATASVGDVS
jgi:hypothetical protein